MAPLYLSAVFLAGAAVLALTLPSTWPLLVARVVLLGLGVAFLAVGLRRRRQRSSPS